ncbi:MAG: sialate O-acetylesterase [Lentisphaerales bacterium]|nr:sialate O-acetylesterase [Lentisphaerales bacterium]
MLKILLTVAFYLLFSIQSSAQNSTVDIFIIAGQSNAAGRGVVSNLTELQKTQNAQFFGSWHKFLNNATSESPQYHSGWLPQTIAGKTRAGISTQNNGNYSETFVNSDWFGPEIGFVKRANEINLTPNPMAIIKYTVDGSALIADPATTYQVSDWDTVKTGFADGDCWKGFKAALTAAVDSLPEDTTPNFKGMIWWQGENGTNATDLKVFITAVRNHLGANFGVQKSSQFPVIITGNKFWGAGLKTNVADLDDYVGFIDSVTYGQIGGYTNTHIGSGENGQSLDVDDNGTNDVFDIGQAYANEMALLIDTPETEVTTYQINFINVDGSETSQTVNKEEVATPPAGLNTTDKKFTEWPTIKPAYKNTTYTALYEDVVTGGGNIVDVFIATGQSNAVYPLYNGEDNKYAFGRGVQEKLTASGQFSNPTVVLAGEPGRPIAYWWAEFWPGAYNGYDSQFFDINNNGTGKLEAKINQILANGDTPRFRGIFWFQGESDGLGPYATADTSQENYQARWSGLLEQLNTDLQAAGLSHSDYHFVFNTVSESGNKINQILTNVANTNSKGAIYDAVNSPYHDQDVIIEKAYGNLHDYDHFSVGTANAQLFIDSFLNIQPPNNSTDNSTAGVSLTLSQTTNAGQGVTSIDLTSQGGLDWAVWNGGNSTPNQSMAGGSGFSGLSAIGSTTFGNGFFHSQNSYNWSNASEQNSGSTTLAGNATISSMGDGVSLTVTVDSAGSYQLKFYASTYDVNLTATAALSSGSFSDSVVGNYVKNSVEKYEYTIDFTTQGADTLTLDLTKSDGASFIFAQEAFSLKAMNIIDDDTDDTDDSDNEGQDTNDNDQTLFEGATIWDGQANDNLWSTALNWSDNLLPNIADDIYIGTSKLVTDASADFASLYLDADSQVSFSFFYPNNKIFNINGVLDLDSPTAFRPYGSYFHLSSTGSFGSSVQWLDLGQNSILSFDDGATFESYTSLEIRGTVSLDFKLSETGFSPLNLGGLYD